MKTCNVFWIFILLKYSNGTFYGVEVGPECITSSQLIRATEILCQDQRNNKTLWDRVIECHRPMTDTLFRIYIFWFKWSFSLAERLHENEFVKGQASEKIMRPSPF